MMFPTSSSFGYDGTLAGSLRYAQTVQQQASNQEQFNLNNTDMLFNTQMGQQFIDNLFSRGYTDINSLVMLSGALDASFSTPSSMFQPSPMAFNQPRLFSALPLPTTPSLPDATESAMPAYRFAESGSLKNPSVTIQDGVPVAFEGDPRFSNINSMVNDALQGVAPAAGGMVQLKHGAALKNLKNIDPELAKGVEEELIARETPKPS
ncbi:MAG: hypothetical protein ACKO34_03195 [Vampirovibrionales bacterium]